MPEKPSDLSDEQYQDWINIDKNLETAREPTKKGICDEPMRTNVGDQPETDDDDNNDKPPTNKEVMNAITVPRYAVQHRADCTVFEQHYLYERAIMKLIDEGKNQTTVEKIFELKS